MIKECGKLSAEKEGKEALIMRYTGKSSTYDVIIIGAGPSGIFCAYELKRQKPELRVLMIEKGRSIEQRSCPKRKTKVCVGCKPCSITTGFAGAGAFSDGKYNITNQFGGTLYEYIGKDRATELMKYVDQINLSHGGEGTKL